MKKFFTLFLIASGICTASYAQYYAQGHALARPKPEIGIDFGYNGAWVFQPYDYYGSPGISGFNAGISLDYPLAPFWSVKVKAIYDQKGWADGYLVDNNGNVFNGVDFRLHYITVPVMANWHFGQVFYMNFGPYIGFLVDATTIGGANVKDNFNTVDGGFAFGVGVKFPISKAAKLFFEYDSQAGLGNITTDYQGDALYNFRYSFNLGVSFPIK
ncbi:MAG TPA: porin family protein [Mucilaginibacter sp.]|jgi:hypothetical protein